MKYLSIVLLIGFTTLGSAQVNFSKAEWQNVLVTLSEDGDFRFRVGQKTFSDVDECAKYCYSRFEMSVFVGLNSGTKWRNDVNFILPKPLSLEDRMYIGDRFSLNKVSFCLFNWAGPEGVGEFWAYSSDKNSPRQRREKNEANKQKERTSTATAAEDGH